MITTEFNKSEYVALFNYNGLPMGRMLTFSKSIYLEENPENLIVFNANILTEKQGKIWFGDLDVTKDFNKLKEVADTLNENLYILRESDARFGKENEPIENLLCKAVTIIKCRSNENILKFDE